MDSKRTIRYESISDILISMFSGINKCLQGRNIFVIDFGSPRYQKFVISLICVSAEFPTYIGVMRVHEIRCMGGMDVILGFRPGEHGLGNKENSIKELQPKGTETYRQLGV